MSDLSSGVPPWLAATLNYCSRCASPLRVELLPTEDRARLVCGACGYIAYLNPRLVVGTIPVTAEGNLVLIRRGIEPAYGAWAQPGGFLEIDETAHQGAIRETLEETGYVVELRDVIGIYTRPQAAVVVVAWEAAIVGGAPRPSAETLEVRTFAPAEIPWPELAFQTTVWALRDWLARRDPLQSGPPEGGNRGRWPLDSA
jgi:ADP-ribose pyrophosphatase YjhB (NUDIX family)